MFEKLLQFEAPSENAGVIWSLEGDHYLAFQINDAGQVVKRADHAFNSLCLAKDWLHKEGIRCISLRQSQAYFEMIGQADETEH